ncbi:gamma-butyrobetaine dioxygenase [Reticulomyxa filosa]|uniref:Gamma-butyrobetaine dioxygenase n=1 Tax=Reticulomyxa filosa TaxID=46433 RepID=X6M618_RETFI|nr:gamma-butyrobetaine dioxygenase [Reticulomyxa filosa]|eukprot:ETO09096.1 gamma-butyrobetaine dioxygenase [Reticulomyxa filosa]
MERKDANGLFKAMVGFFKKKEKKKKKEGVCQKYIKKKKENFFIKKKKNVETLLRKNLAIELRENCECNECSLKSKATKQRKGTERIKEDVMVMELKDEGDKIKMRWSDGHEGWIGKEKSNKGVKMNELGEEVDSEEKEKKKYVLWDGKTIGGQEHDISFDYNELMKDDKQVVDMIEKLEKFGIVKVKKSFGTVGAAKIIGKRIGLIRSTIYGDSFVVTSNRELLSTESQAFTNNDLPSHTDLPYYQMSPDIFVFHCIQNSIQGGDSYYVDGFKIAYDFQALFPQHFDILTSVKVPFRKNFTDKGFDLISNHHIIELNPRTHSIQRIHFDEGNRQSLNWNLPLDEKRTFHAALDAFRAFVALPSFRFQFQMTPGEITVFDNRRVLHARTAFVGTRIMEGCYLDWPSINAVYRSLTAKS